MRVLGLFLLAPLCAMAQTPDAPKPAAPKPAALVRGILLERDTQISGGQFSVRDADNLVRRYLFDRKTYVERENQMIDILRLNPGEKLEVISDVVPGQVLRYARTVHVIPDAPPPRPPSPGRLRPYRPSEDRILSGNLTYSGVVFRVNPERVAVHTRAGDQMLLVRKDTRFVQDGEIVEAASLKPNTRVFIRAGKDVYEQVEIGRAHV